MYLDFLSYFAKASNAHGIHSPFVYELYNQVYKNKVRQPIFYEIEASRRQLEQDRRTIEITDLGAGSRRGSLSKKTVKQIAQKSLKSPKWAKFFFNLIQYYHHQNILELGTSLGITTAYLAAANPLGRVVTLEGCSQTLEIARETFGRHHLNNIVAIHGNINQTLKKALTEIKQVDFVLFDANHRLQPTLKYFEQCLPFSHSESIFIFDDIYWSNEMKTAWQSIQKDPRVSISIDLFYIGLVFFRQGVEKQHFVLR